MIYIIHKIFVLFKNQLNYFKNYIFKCLFKEFIFTIYKDKISRLQKYKKELESGLIQDVRNHFRLKKELNDTTIKKLRNIFGLEKENKAIKNRVIRDIQNLSKLKKKIKEIKNRATRDIRDLFKR